jgi:hypothetical protein
MAPKDKKTGTKAVVPKRSTNKSSKSKRISVLFYGKRYHFKSNKLLLPALGDIFEQIDNDFNGVCDDVINNVPLLRPTYPLFLKHKDRLVLSPK